MVLWKMVKWDLKQVLNFIKLMYSDLYKLSTDYVVGLICNQYRYSNIYVYTRNGGNALKLNFFSALF